jgi:acetyltransferase-like isoleucine patch superfamily enzyme
MKKVFRSLLTHYKAACSGATIGRRTQIHIQAALERRGGTIVIGSKCEIHQGAKLLAYGGTIRIGDDCSINPDCILYGHGGLVIGNHVRIAAGCVLIPANHVFDAPDRLIRDQGETRKGIKIGNDVWLGANAIVLDGVEIAEGCVIGAGAVVTKTTEPYGIYVGNPARFLRRRGGGITGSGFPT